MTRSLNLVGKKFGKGVVKHKIRSDRPAGVLWRLQCDCGNEYEAYTRILNSKKVKSCGCLKSRDLSGVEYGWGTVLCSTDKRRDRKVVWRLRCKCGIEYEANTSDLSTGNIKSCGCMIYRKCYGDISGSFYSQIRKGARERNIEFDVSIEDLYSLFVNQEKRCSLTGVDLSIQRSAKKHYQGLTTASLDRIDRTKGYVEGNIQWVHKKVNFMKQSMNNQELLAWCEKVVSWKLSGGSKASVELIERLPDTYLEEETND